MNFHIRPIKAGDGAGINELRRMPGVFENILGIPSERIKRNEDGIAAMDASIHSFVAVKTDDDGNETIIGNAALYIEQNHRRRHVGSIGMMVHADFQGMGIGTKLLETILDISDNWLMLVRVELTVFTDNERAIRMYKKFGFSEEGVMRKAAIRNGTYVDNLAMARIKG